jgi:hypothetical protein
VSFLNRQPLNKTAGSTSPTHGELKVGATLDNTDGNSEAIHRSLLKNNEDHKNKTGFNDKKSSAVPKHVPLLQI